MIDNMPGQHQIGVMARFLGMFFTYLRWSLEFLYVPPFAYGTLLLCLNLGASIVRQRPHHEQVRKLILANIALQLFCLSLAIAVGVIGRVNWEQRPFPGPNRRGLWAEDALLLGSIVICAYSTWKMRGLRWFAVSLSLVQLLILVAAEFVAGMSLTGTWL